MREGFGLDERRYVTALRDQIYSTWNDRTWYDDITTSSSPVNLNPPGGTTPLQAVRGYRWAPRNHRCDDCQTWVQVKPAELLLSLAKYDRVKSRDRDNAWTFTSPNVPVVSWRSPARSNLMGKAVSHCRVVRNKPGLIESCLAFI